MSRAGSGAPDSVDLLVRAGVVATMNPARELIRDGAVAISGSRIVAVGKASDLERRYRATRVIDHSAGLVTPGLVDAHNHPQDYLLRGVIDDLGDWVERIGRYVAPYEFGISAEETYLAARANFAEMLLHGTTCFADPGGLFPDAIAQAAVDVGIRGVVARVCMDVAGPLGVPVEDTDVLVARATETVERWNGAAGGLIRAQLGLGLPVSVTDELCRGLVEQSRALGVGVVGHFHGARPDDHDGGRNPQLARYESLGVWAEDTLMAHIGWLHPEDVAVLARYGVKAVHCPSQSMFGGAGMVGHGVIPELMAAGITVGLGTDAACVSRFLDLVRVMNLAACAHRDVRLDPALVGAHRAFEMGTIGGARALSWQDEIGSLEPGKRADLVLFDTSGPEWQPHGLANPIADLVYSASGRSARTVVVDGRVVVEDGTLTALDPVVLVAETDRATTAIFDRFGFASRPIWPVT